ncbi:MAG: 2OG-Fe(II) oxygenase [Paraglaciecola polaris]|uniref:2OG-Fe(II) oxygenase n=1 Tax=Paraglaciecola polaris TaxID=222814 RepID=UPI003001088D
MLARVRNKVLFTSKRVSAYLVTYPNQHKVMNHIDPVPNGRYYKFNIVLKQPKIGGVFHCQKCIMNFFGRIYLFRPDKYEHSVTRIEQGKRVLLSLSLII